MQTDRVLLMVDDSRPDALALQVLLQAIGVRNRIVSLSDGRSALDYLGGLGRFADRHQHPFPAIVFLDLRMPDVDGFDILEWMRPQPRFKDVLAVVLSACDDIRHMNYAYALGARSFLVKPCNAPELQNLIEAYPKFWEIHPPGVNAQSGTAIQESKGPYRA